MSNSTLVGSIPAPPGVVPDFNIHHLTSTQMSFILAYSITLGLALFTLSLRMYTRISIIKNFGLDDAVILIAMTCSIASCGLTMDSIKYGMGRHLWEVTPAQLAVYVKRLSAMGSLYGWTTTLTKLSTLLLLHRLNPSKWFRAPLYLTAISMVVYTLTLGLLGQFPCSPTKPGSSGCLAKVGLWQAIFGIITDVAVLALPLPMLYHLNLPSRQKWALIPVFGSGVLVVVMCIVRIVYIQALINNIDFTWSQGRAAIWSAVEMNVGIICNTVIVLKPALRRHFPSFFSSHDRSTTAPTNRGGTHRFTTITRDQQDDMFNFQMFSLENEFDASGKSIEGKKSTSHIVVTNTFNMTSSKIAGDSESTEDMIEPSEVHFRT